MTCKELGIVTHILIIRKKLNKLKINDFVWPIWEWRLQGKPLLGNMERQVNLEIIANIFLLKAEVSGTIGLSEHFNSIFDNLLKAEYRQEWDRETPGVIVLVGPHTFMSLFQDEEATMMKGQDRHPPGSGSSREFFITKACISKEKKKKTLPEPYSICGKSISSIISSLSVSPKWRLGGKLRNSCQGHSLVTVPLKNWDLIIRLLCNTIEL